MKKTVSSGLVILGMGFALGYTGCSSAPKNDVSINASADATTEVANTRSSLEATRKDLGEHLAPTKFKNAEKSLVAAEEGLAKKKSNEKIFADLAESRSWLEQAKVVIERSKATFASPLAARASAVAVPSKDDKKLRAADSDLADLAKKIEKGDGVDEKKIAALKMDYVNVERDRVTQTHLNPIENRIDQAKSMNAKKLAPKTFARAQSDFEAAQKTLKIDPYDRDQVSDRIQTAFRSSNELLEIARETAKTPGASTEELVLAARQRDRMNRQQLNAAEARYENAVEGNARVSAENQNLKATVGELKEEAQPQVILQKLRSELPEETADIMMTPSGKIMVRLKQLQFKTNSSELSPEAATVVNNVRSALAEINPKSLTIEGHTDSTGTAARNKTLSASRAATVATVLKGDDTLKTASIESKGFGAEKPLKNNQTKEGRAENRRVEITIEQL